MLSQSSRQEILRKIASKTGYTVNEANLTPPTRQAITNLATVQRHLFVVTEILRGENSRMEGSFLLRAASRVGMDSEKSERKSLGDEINSLQAEIDAKVSELAGQVTAEDSARQAGTAPPEYKVRLELVELKCPQCGATLPLPTGRFTTCQYCKAAFTIEDVSSQLKSMIQGI
jgi:hypothetical protein